MADLRRFIYFTFFYLLG